MWLLCFAGSLTSDSCIAHVAMVSGCESSDHLRCVSFNNEPRQPRPTFVSLNPDELHYYSFAVIFKISSESCNAIDDPLGRICSYNKIEDAKPKVFKMIRFINEPKKFAKHISCECKMWIRWWKS